MISSKFSGLFRSSEWKEGHLYIAGKLSSSHFRIGKSFLENLLRNEILRSRNISDFQKITGNSK